MDYDETPQETLTIQGVEYVTSACASLLLLYISLFGRHVGLRAIRWHAANSAIWNAIFMVFLASYGDITPWSHYLGEDLPEQTYYEDIMLACLAAFFAGAPFLFIDALLACLSPRLARSRLMSALFAVIITVATTASVVATFVIQIDVKEETQDPQLYDNYLRGALYVFHVIAVFGTYFLICPIYPVCIIVASVIGCATASCGSRPGQKKRAYGRSCGSFYHIIVCWLYIVIAYMGFTAATCMQVYGFLQKVMTDEVNQLQVMAMQYAQENFSGDGEDSFTLMIRMLNLLINTVRWSTSSVGLFECVAVLLFFHGYQKQLIMMFSCGWCCVSGRFGSSSESSCEVDSQPAASAFWALPSIRRKPQAAQAGKTMEVKPVVAMPMTVMTVPPAPIEEKKPIN